MFMRSIFVKLILLLTSIDLVCCLAHAQQKINPATDIRWTAVSGSGAPTAPCTSANYGQPYTDAVEGLQYNCSVAGWTTNGAGGGLPAGCSSSATGSITCSGTIASAVNVADVERSNINWYDVRNFNVVCNGKTLSGGPPWTSGTNTTAAMIMALQYILPSGAAQAANSEVELPPAPWGGPYGGPGTGGTDNMCLITPGQLILPSATSGNYTIDGRGPNATVLFDATNNSTSTSEPPLLQIGDNAGTLMTNTNLRDFGLNGAPYSVYPNGVLDILSDQISVFRNLSVHIGNNAIGSIGINFGSATFANELKFEDISVYGTSSIGGTGIKFPNGTGNVSITGSNFEELSMGIDYAGHG